VKLVVLRVGKGRTRWADEACTDYAERIARHLTIEEQVIATARTIEDESEALLAKIKDRDRLVVLDPRGSKSRRRSSPPRCPTRRASAPGVSCSRSADRSATPGDAHARVEGARAVAPRAQPRARARRALRAALSGDRHSLGREGLPPLVGRLRVIRVARLAVRH
jgi:hypothetical protein